MAVTVPLDGRGARVNLPAGLEDLSPDRQGGGSGRHEEPPHAQAPPRAGLPGLGAAGNGVRDRDWWVAGGGGRGAGGVWVGS